MVIPAASASNLSTDSVTSALLAAVSSGTMATAMASNAAAGSVLGSATINKEATVAAIEIVEPVMITAPTLLPSTAPTQSGPTTPAPTVQKTLEVGLTGAPLSQYTDVVKRAFERAIAEMVDVPVGQVAITRLISDDSRRSSGVRIRFTINAPSEKISAFDLKDPVVSTDFETRFYSYAQNAMKLFTRPTLGWVIETVYVDSTDSGADTQNETYDLAFWISVFGSFLGLSTAIGFVIYCICYRKCRSNRTMPDDNDSSRDHNLSVRRTASRNRAWELKDGVPSMGYVKDKMEDLKLHVLTKKRLPNAHEVLTAAMRENVALSDPEQLIAFTNSYAARPRHTTLMGTSPNRVWERRDGEARADASHIVGLGVPSMEDADDAVQDLSLQFLEVDQRTWEVNTLSDPTTHMDSASTTIHKQDISEQQLPNSHEVLTAAIQAGVSLTDPGALVAFTKAYIASSEAAPLLPLAHTLLFTSNEVYGILETGDWASTDDRSPQEEFEIGAPTRSTSELSFVQLDVLPGDDAEDADNRKNLASLTERFSTSPVLNLQPTPPSPDKKTNGRSRQPTPPISVKEMQGRPRSKHTYFEEGPKPDSHEEHISPSSVQRPQMPRITLHNNDQLPSHPPVLHEGLSTFVDHSLGAPRSVVNTASIKNSEEREALAALTKFFEK